MKYEIEDPKALLFAHPHLFKQVPDHTKVRAAIKAGFELPGVKIIDEKDELADIPAGMRDHQPPAA